MQKNSYFGIWVDKEILKIVKNGNERLLLGMIVSLSKKVPCTASNDYFARELCLSGGQVSKLISRLQKDGIIKRFVDKENGNKRKITIDKKYYSLYSNESIPIDENEDRLYSKTSTNNIVDNININTSTTTEKLKNNLDLVEGICKDLNIDKKNVYGKIPDFIKFIKEVRRVHKSDSDLFLNFKSWMSSRKSNIKVNLEEGEKNYLWFIEAFNKISKRTFLPSDITRELFAKQFENGFTPEHFMNAISNLYSSDVGNKFHIERSFKFATPEYLLKDDNINKYLNVRWSNNKIKKMVRIG